MTTAWPAPLKLQLIPEITDAQIVEMLYVMWPVHKFTGDDEYRLIAPSGIDFRSQSYPWVDRPHGRAVGLGNRNHIGTILTMHTWAYYGFFKPTLAEVLAFIRRDVKDWERVRFFHVDGLEVVGDKAGGAMVNSGVHVAVCSLFGEEMP